MRTGARITLTIALLAVATAIGVVAYQAGIDAGVATADGTEVVRVVDGWRGGPGFFPGFLFFPLFVFGFFFLARFVVWGGRGWGGPPGRHHDWERRADDWHRRQHADDRGGADHGRDTADPEAWPEGRT